ncbi:MAG: radical SAM family heme chaperone HemW [Phycisphaeraceae bacterium]|nr:radical SAM family heme chaperone HemW [Phycisphaeraceae bacterium]
MTDSGAQTSPAPSAVYVHIPFCASKCTYCAFYSEPVSRHNTQRLMQAIHKELSQADTRSVRTVYVGGGSPSCLPAHQLFDLVKAIRNQCPNIEEFTVECNPGQVNPDMLTCLHDLGVNRLSMGAQSFDPEELQRLQRGHTAQTVCTAVHQARQAGFENLSLDLIFAICGSTQVTWQASLDKAIALDPDHISAYALTLEPNTPLALAVTQGQLNAMDAATDRAMYEQAIDTLTRAGYEQYEISNFAKPGHACEHNLGTWHNLPYLGFGPSAASYDGYLRTQNVSDIKAYVDALESGQSPVKESVFISPADRICETAVLNLRTRHGIDVKRFVRDTGQDPHLLFAGAIQKHHEQGFLTIKQDRLCLTDRALPIADSVLCDFAAL